MLGSIEQQSMKRMNIIYQSLSNPSDIFAITLPGTNDFFIPSVEDINQRFSLLQKDLVMITGIYNDSLSRSKSGEKLLSLRTV